MSITETAQPVVGRRSRGNTVYAAAGAGVVISAFLPIVNTPLGSVSAMSTKAGPIVILVGLVVLAIRFGLRGHAGRVVGTVLLLVVGALGSLGSIVALVEVNRLASASYELATPGIGLYLLTASFVALVAASLVELVRR